MTDFARHLALLAVIGAAAVAWRTLKTRRRDRAAAALRATEAARMPRSFHIDRHPVSRSPRPAYEKAAHVSRDQSRLADAAAALRRRHEDDAALRHRGDDATGDHVAMTTLLVTQTSTTWSAPASSAGGSGCAAPISGSGDSGGDSGAICVGE